MTKAKKVKKRKAGPKRNKKKQLKVPVVTPRDLARQAYKRSIPFDIYLLTGECCRIIDHTIQYTIKFWYQQIPMVNIEEEIKNELIILLMKDYNLFVEGSMERFPQAKTYYAKGVWLLLLARYCPLNSLERHGVVLPYNTLEYYDTEFKMYPASSKHKANVNPQVFGDEDPFLNYPDMMAFWELGFSVLQLSAIYKISVSNVRKRVNDFYDAMELNNEKPSRRRPKRWRKKWKRNYFLSKEYTKKLEKFKK